MGLLRAGQVDEAKQVLEEAFFPKPQGWLGGAGEG
jgi:hypothetical protein